MVDVDFSGESDRGKRGPVQSQHLVDSVRRARWYAARVCVLLSAVCLFAVFCFAVGLSCLFSRFSRAALD